MSNRTIIELNHDYCPHTDEGATELGKVLMQYMTSGDSKFLPNGIRYFGMRHHSDPLPDLLNFGRKDEERKYSHPAMKALHDLTPGGSEFAGDPKYCADYIRNREHSQHETIIAKYKENKELKAELERVQGLLKRMNDKWLALSRQIHAIEVKGASLDDQFEDAWQEMTMISEEAFSVEATSTPTEPSKDVEPEKPKGCNRHDDCAAAEAKLLAEHPGKTISLTFHCHDECCEDCFGY